MRISLNLSDELFRRVKAMASRRGRTVAELIEEGLLHVLESADIPAKKSRTKKTLSELMQDVCGIEGS